ncbi:MAG: hypothetical protein ACF8GE_12005 [Phycisphaerales bacterium JB043]
MAVSVHAQSGIVDSTRLDEMRRLIDRQRALVREGRLDPRLVVSPLVLDDRYPPPSRGVARSTSHLRHNVNQLWGALVDSNDFVLDFEDPAYQITTLDPTTSSPFVSLEGVVDPQTGNAWWGPDGSGFTGIVDNTAAQTGGNWDPDGADDDPLTEGVLDGDPDQHGEVGGPDPLGLHGKFVAAAAGSHTNQAARDTTGRLDGWLTAKFFAPRAQAPVVTIVDLYLDREDSSVWYSPISETEGNFFALSSFWLGHASAEFSFLADSDNIIRRPFILGHGSPDGPKFYVHPESSPWRIKTDEWFSVALRMTVDSYSVWVRDSQTIPLCGFEQNSIYDGLTGDDDPNDTRGAFAGELFESEWLQLLPGVDDDPLTSSIEGWGRSHNDFLQTYHQKFDQTGSLVSGTFNTVGIDALHFRSGFDPSVTDMPDWKPNDYYLDNWIMMGMPFDYCVSDFNGDGITNGVDLGTLLGNWGVGYWRGDLNNDGMTDGADLGLLLGAWGACP